MPTYQQAQQLLYQQLSAAGIDSARSEAQQLVMAVLKLDRLALVMHAGEVLSEAQWDELQRLAGLRATRVPLQHLLGEVEWAGLSLSVSPAALIPRPETEVLLELATQELRRLALPAAKVLDVGTGTGALALALKQRFPTAQVTASDISPEALALAQHNALRCGLNVNFVQSDLLKQLHGPFDLLVSNPPYLPHNDAAHAQPEVRHDPALALYSGPDGLDLARRLCAQAAHVLPARTPLLLELDPRNVQTLAQELSRQGWTTYTKTDLTGRERFLVAYTPPDL